MTHLKMIRFYLVKKEVKKVKAGKISRWSFNKKNLFMKALTFLSLRKARSIILRSCPR